MGQAGNKVRYDFTVSGTEVRVTRDGNPLDIVFATTEKDTAASASPLHTFLEEIGQSRVDAHSVCQAVEQGKTVHGVFGKAVKINAFKLVEDTSGCKHEFIVGPQRKLQNHKQNIFVGHCDSCRREVALELNQTDERTGKSWLIEYGAQSGKESK